jgi:hypothetical protein
MHRLWFDENETNNKIGLVAVLSTVSLLPQQRIMHIYCAKVISNDMFLIMCSLFSQVAAILMLKKKTVVANTA